MLITVYITLIHASFESSIKSPNQLISKVRLPSKIDGLDPLEHKFLNEGRLFVLSSLLGLTDDGEQVKGHVHSSYSDGQQPICKFFYPLLGKECPHDNSYSFLLGSGRPRTVSMVMKVEIKNAINQPSQATPQTQVILGESLEKSTSSTTSTPTTYYQKTFKVNIKYLLHEDAHSDRTILLSLSSECNLLLGQQVPFHLMALFEVLFLRCHWLSYDQFHLEVVDSASAYSSHPNTQEVISLLSEAWSKAHETSRETFSEFLVSCASDTESSNSFGTSVSAVHQNASVKVASINVIRLRDHYDTDDASELLLLLAPCKPQHLIISDHMASSVAPSGQQIVRLLNGLSSIHSITQEHEVLGIDPPVMPGLAISLAAGLPALRSISLQSARLMGQSVWNKPGYGFQMLENIGKVWHTGDAPSYWKSKFLSQIKQADETMQNQQGREQCEDEKLQSEQVAQREQEGERNSEKAENGSLVHHQRPLPFKSKLLLTRLALPDIPESKDILSMWKVLFPHLNTLSFPISLWHPTALQNKPLSIQSYTLQLNQLKSLALTCHQLGIDLELSIWYKHCENKAIGTEDVRLDGMMELLDAIRPTRVISMELHFEDVSSTDVLTLSLALQLQRILNNCQYFGKLYVYVKVMRPQTQAMVAVTRAGLFGKEQSYLFKRRKPSNAFFLLMDA